MTSSCCRCCCISHLLLPLVYYHPLASPPPPLSPNLEFHMYRKGIGRGEGGRGETDRAKPKLTDHAPLFPGSWQLRRAHHNGADERWIHRHRRHAPGLLLDVPADFTRPPRRLRRRRRAHGRLCGTRRRRLRSRPGSYRCWQGPCGRRCEGGC